MNSYVTHGIGLYANKNLVNKAYKGYKVPFKFKLIPFRRCRLYHIKRWKQDTINDRVYYIPDKRIYRIGATSFIAHPTVINKIKQLEDQDLFTKKNQ